MQLADSEIIVMNKVCSFVFRAISLNRNEMNKYKGNRRFMKSSMSDYDLIATADIANGVPQPPFQKQFAEDSKLINLQQVNSLTAPKADFFECTSSRISRRAYSEESMTIDELSF